MMYRIYVLVFFWLLLYVSLTVASKKNVHVENSSLQTTSNEAKNLLKALSISQDKHIVFEATSPEISNCLHEPDVKPRLLQVCSAHELAMHCDNNTQESTYVLFDRCTEDVCYSRIDTKGVYCRMANRRQNSSSLEIRSNKPAIAKICGLPLDLSSFFNRWNLPQWMASIGGVNNFHCLTAFPNGTKTHWRFVCVNGSPVLELRIRFPKPLLMEYRGPQCIVKDHCGGATIFSSYAICFESVYMEATAISPENEDIDFDSMTELTSEDISKGDFIVPPFLLLILMISFLLMFFETSINTWAIL